MKRFFKGLMVLIILMAVSGGGIFFAFQAYNKVYPGDVTFFEGASARDISDILEVNGNIKNADVFYYYLRGKEMFYDVNPWSDKTFKPDFKNGTFEIGTGDFDYLVGYISDFKNHKKQTTGPEEKYTTIPEGYTVEQVAEVLAKRNIVNKEAFLAAMNDKVYYQSLQQKYFWLPEINEKKKYLLEGFLHPNSYDFELNSLPHIVIEKMMEQTNAYYEANKVLIVSQPYSFDQLITMASVVERESKFAEDRPKVAQVFYNRLQTGMKLQSDITVLYSLDQHKTFVTYEDLKIDSPYNTYMYAGLPVGPINSPSIQAVNAVLYPAGKEFQATYFYARPTGETFYSNTLAEHERIRQKYEQEWLDLN